MSENNFKDSKYELLYLRLQFVCMLLGRTHGGPGQIVLKKRVRALCQNAVIDYIRRCVESACLCFVLFCFFLKLRGLINHSKRHLKFNSVLKGFLYWPHSI